LLEICARLAVSKSETAKMKKAVETACALRQRFGTGLKPGVNEKKVGLDRAP
jgi:hypothetical protein